MERKVVVFFCHDGYTKRVCIHKLALDMHQGRLSKLVLLQPTGKRGRKRKVVKALEKEINLVLKKSKKCEDKYPSVIRMEQSINFI